MKASQFFISTQKEAPAEAEIISHQLMMRAGLIKRIGSGIYTYMPMGLRSVRKVEAIVREEMNKAGAMELLMPAVQPAELWQESGRWEQYGPELLRFKDRHARDFVVGPTHEEVITDVVRRDFKSYKQLPANFYQIQTKFRDEIRPRFGVMRGREFIMKDAYSFDKDAAGLQASYDKMFNAYVKIFTRMGLNFRAVAADNGSIGGDGSHEFHVIAETGEPRICTLPVEHAEFTDNWDVIGLRATGSIDYSIREVFVPEAWTYRVFVQEPARGGSLFRLGTMNFAGICHAGWTLGLARRLLDEVAEQARAGKGRAGQRKGNGGFHKEFAEIEGRFRAAEALVFQTWQGVEQTLAKDESLSTREETLVRLALTNLTETGLEVANFALRATATLAIRNGVVGRYIRDMMTGATHLTSSQPVTEAIGRELQERRELAEDE